MKNTEKGLNIEKEILDHICTYKYVENMNKNIQSFLKDIFPNEDYSKEITAYKYHENYKPDIVIVLGKQKKYISIKSGSNNSIHQEHIYSFCNFLQEIEIKEEIIEGLKLAHFNDGTTNGSGSKRKDIFSFYEEHPSICQRINVELNKKENATKIITRILFDGEYKNLPSVDYVYHGTVENGVWASKKEILNYLNNVTLSTLSIHVSKLYYQCLQRNLKNKPENEFRRYYIQFKWHSLKNDLTTIKTK